LVSELCSINQVNPFEIFGSCCFRKKILSVQFIYKKKIVVSFYYCSKYISSIKNKKREKKKEKKSFKKTFIGFCRRKLNKGKLDQINSELAQILESDY
jgi:hypothetical protein